MGKIAEYLERLGKWNKEMESLRKTQPEEIEIEEKIFDVGESDKRTVRVYIDTGGRFRRRAGGLNVSGVDGDFEKPEQLTAVIEHLKEILEDM